MFLEPTPQFRYRNTQEFIDFVRSGEANLYMYVGRSQPWADDTQPPPDASSDRGLREIWDDMIMLRRVRPGDVCEGVRRVVWTEDTVYSEYDDAADLQDQDFFVVTQPENNIYICVDNNEGAPSTQKPTHRDENVVEESDGYKWKYISTVSASLANKFILNDYIAISQDQETFEAANPGSIEHIKVEASGSGYRPNASIANSNEIPVFIQGNGTQVYTATASVSVIQGSITSISLFTGGSGYFYGPGVEFPVAIRQVTPNGTVQNAYGVATTNLDGEIDSVELKISGSGYQSGLVTLVQSSAEGYAETNEDGEIINAEVRIGRSGDDFFKATGVIVAEEGSGGSVIPVVSPTGGFGANQFRQLYSHYALISVEVDTVDVLNQLSISDFRRVGLIIDPVEYIDNPLSSDGLLDSDGGNLYDSDGEIEGTVLTADTVDAKHKVVLSGDNTSFVEDETIIGETSGTIGLNSTKFQTDAIRVSIDDSYISADDLEFEVGEQIRGLTSGATGTVASFTPPGVEKYSGQILHINNIEPIVRNDDQRILVTFVLRY